MCEICGKEEVHAKGKCNRCYQVIWRKEHPEKYKTEKFKASNIERTKRWREKNPEKWKEMRRKSSRKYYLNHKDKISEYNKNRRIEHPLSEEEKKELSDKIHKYAVCNILKKHAKDLKDDPDRLSTDFIKKMSNIKFRCNEKS